MNMFELFKLGPKVVVKLTKDGLQVIFKHIKLRSACTNRTRLHTFKSKAILRDRRDSRTGQLFVRCGTHLKRIGASDEFPKRIFSRRNKTNIITCG